ncbi:MAG: hypothetical protein ABIT04_09945 [Novosphingobium sp.]
MRSGAWRRLGIWPVLFLTAGGCTGGGIVPPPRPSPPTLVPTPAPPAPAPAATDWRDLPATSGDWSWGMEAGGSEARFGEGLLVLRCDRTRGRIELRRAGDAASGGPITVTTTTISRPLVAERGEATLPAIRASLPVGDPLLDAMAFSRGRFLLAATALPTLIIPSWPELSRVIEDCR